MYRVDLVFRVEDVLACLPEEGLREVMETIAAVLARPGSWPPPGGWAGAYRFGARAWVWFAAYPDGIEVLDVGWAG